MADTKPRKLFWWNMPISADDNARVGGGMMRAIVIWFAVVVFLAALGVAIAAIA